MTNELSLLQRIEGSDLSELMALWRSRTPEEWKQGPEIYRAVSEAILRQGEPLLAYDVISEGLTVWPNDTRLRQLQGLSLARSGATERASAILEKLRSEGATDEETLGMLGRTYKDLGLHAVSPAEREKFLKRAADIYSEGYAASGGFWSGINAATMNLLIGNVKRAQELAQKVHKECEDCLEASGTDQYWCIAALGEASLILERWTEAEEWYARAGRAGATRFGDLHSTRRNAHLILQHWKRDSATIDQHLRVPPVVVFAGHMIDRADRSRPRFPKELEPAVAEAIREEITAIRPGFGFASAACGSDILFLEAMLDAGAEISIVLPYNQDVFIADSVDFVPSGNWRERFQRVLEKATRVVTASNHRLEIGGVSYDFCNQMLLGLATIRSHQLETDLIPLAVWDKQPGDGPGGSHSVVENWRSLGYQPRIIDLSALAQPNGAQDGGRRTSQKGEVEDKFGSRVVAILFADAVGFSKLSEGEVPRFVDQFLAEIARLSEKFGDSIVARNTWGDGLYFILSEVPMAGKFALALADLVCNTKWEERGLRAGLNLRIALHAGPAYEFIDPITGNRSFSGTHVSQAARLEPITPPGQVYSSEAFAALAAAQHAADFTCDYVGQTPMAKGYGTLPTYHARRILR